MTRERENKEKPVAKQRFDIPRWVESELAEIDLTVAVAEIIDNAMDETLPGETCSVFISFDAKSGSITFENKNTQGMDIEKMQEFPLWAGKHTDPDKIKEHRLGGKLAILSLISKETGSVTVTSKPRNSDVAYQMSIDNWWKKLLPDEEFAIETIQYEEPDKLGRTRFELTGVEDIPYNITDLADELGVIYGPLIQDEKLSITLRRLPPRGKRYEETQVLPVTIPFKKSLVKLKESVPTGKKGKGPQISVRWGLIDQERKKRDEAARRSIYEAKSVNSIKGDSLYLYYHGRLLSKIPLSSLKIPGHTVKHIFQSFVVSADIVEGWAPKTILKKALSASASETKDIFQKITSLVEDDVSALVKESDSDKVPARYVERAKEASTALASVLNEVFDNNIEEMVETFNLPTRGWEVVSLSKKPKERKQTSKDPTLPGMRAPAKETKEKKAGRKRSVSKPVWINPVPEFKISPFSENSPEAILSIDNETGKPVIELNYTSPSVAFALRQRGRVYVGELLRIGATALYHEKWLQQFSKDSQSYWEGLQKDVAEFLSKASELKII